MPRAYSGSPRSTPCSTPSSVCAWVSFRQIGAAAYHDGNATRMEWGTFQRSSASRRRLPAEAIRSAPPSGSGARSEEHTSELQSRQYLVCRLLLEKKKATLLHLAWILRLP